VQVVGKMAGEVKRLWDAGTLEERAKQITDIDLKTIAVEYGTSVEKDDGEYSIKAASADIDRHFQQTGWLLGNGLHMDYWRYRFETGGNPDADEVEVEAVMLAQDHEGIKRLETFAEGEFDTLYAKHKQDIAKLKEQRQQHFQRLRLATNVPQTIPWTLPDTIDFRRTPNAPEYDKHLFLEDDNKFRADLGTWEQEVLKEELTDASVIGWLRMWTANLGLWRFPTRTRAALNPCFPICW